MATRESPTAEKGTKTPTGARGKAETRAPGRVDAVFLQEGMDHCESDNKKTQRRPVQESAKRTNQGNKRMELERSEAQERELG